MIKKLISALILTLAIANCVYAADYHQTITPEVRRGIQDYKAGNYVGCIQEIYPYLIKNSTNGKNQLAIYYLAMSLSKAGQPEKAKKYYNIAKILNPNNTIGQYSQKGIVCIDDPANCYLNAKPVTSTKSVYESDLDKFINAPYGNGLSSDLNKEIERKKVERLRKEINSDQELNKYEFQNFRDFSKKKGQIFLKKEEGIKLASNTNPTDAEILNAIKVLNAAGLNNIANQAQTAQEQKNNVTNNAQPQEQISKNEVKSEYKPDITREEYQKQIQQEMLQAQMAAMSQPNIDALFGEKNNNNNNNNMMNSNMMNMLPFMMAQQAQNGNTNGQQPMISPDMMQAMMFNSMMPNFNFGIGNGN